MCKRDLRKKKNTSLTSLAVGALVLQVAAFAQRSGIGRYANAAVLTRIVAFAGIRHVAAKSLCGVHVFGKIVTVYIDRSNTNYTHLFE